MDAEAALHPTDDTLAAFGFGKLADADADTIANHVEGCSTCRDRVAGLSGDSFLGRLRAAQGRDGTPAPNGSSTVVARDGRPTPWPGATSDEAVPSELANHPQYEDVRELGKGGMGVVYLARNRLLDRIEVLKVANRALLAAPGVTERFLQEIRAAAQLRHPNVVAAYAALEIDPLLVFAMEYVAGDDLDKVVKAGGPLPVASACSYAHQVALGLQHAHEKGMVHRDIKPHNLILAQEGNTAVVKILDFGLAKVTSEKADSGLTGDGKMLGTPHYIAPEQTLDASRADVRADVYSLGCTLYFLLTGKPPFSGTSVFEVLQAHHSTEAHPVHHVRPDVPEGVSAIVAKMMRKKPVDRYQTPVEVANALVPFFNPGRPSISPDRSGSAVGLGVPPTGSWPELNVAPTLPVPSVAEEPDPGTAEAHALKSARRTPWVLWAAIVAGGLCAGTVGAWGAGLFKVKTADGTIVLENLPDGADVFVDGERVTVTWGDGQKAEVRVRPGTRKVEIKKDGVTVRGEEVEIEDGKRRIVTAKLEPVAPPVPPEQGKQVPVVKGKEPPVKGDGYVALFNGKDLTGWETRKFGPANRRPPWEVADGVLTARFDVFGSWGALLTEKSDYQNFRFRVQMTTIEGDGWAGSMLYLWRERNWYRAQIGSATGRDVAETGVIQHGNLRVTPKLPVRFRTGEWFTQEVVVEGKHISVYINNVLTTEHVLAEQPQPGRLGLSVSGIGTMRIRRMGVKELPPPKTSNQK
ncbi:protein kinase [Gemmata sp. G18]|uniref:Protein kinase n=1 Tax=Gemmata palustris TaxID=2822762 RepID=A0ABS5BLW2_9BACT|nr:protein kinase [Gemmata palustris]MBP3954462.1 protein kinase [Gemmata palustris]